jgi:hypothetical protein
MSSTPIPGYGGLHLSREGLLTFPNPYRARLHGVLHLTFKPSLSGAWVAVFDRDFKKVRSLRQADLDLATGQAWWDGQDESGQRVPAGLYFAVLNSKSDKYCRKFTVLP